MKTPKKLKADDPEKAKATSDQAVEIAQWAGDGVNMADNDINGVLAALGKAQVDAMFRRQDDDAVDDSEFLPLVEVAINAFETAGIDKAVAETVWEYAFEVYDRACKEADPSFTTAENRKMMQKYLLGPRGLKQKPRKRKA